MKRRYGHAIREPGKERAFSVRGVSGNHDLRAGGHRRRLGANAPLVSRARGNFIDTANVYAEGRSEEILGRALRGKRQ
ncbi:MAG: aldo/keto reductase, partial [Candidatus Caldatribacteriaceae bacterium]